VSENCVDILQEIISLNISSSNNKDVLEKLKISVDLIILLLGDGELITILVKMCAHVIISFLIII
jgi:hypothetical protein